MGRFRTTLFIVLAAVGLLLLIGCGNVANLLLARATAREKEFAIRAALGASRWRLVRQLLVESLAARPGRRRPGRASGLGRAQGAHRRRSRPQIIPAEAVIRLNGTVLLFTLAVAIADRARLRPGARAARRRGATSTSRSGTAARARAAASAAGRLRDAVVVLEVALCLALLVGAGLLMRSFVALREVDLGLDPDHVLVARLPLPQDRYKTAEQLAGFYRPLLARLKALPGVVEATETSTLPPYGGIRSEVEVAGQDPPEKWTPSFQLCSEGYFSVLRIRVPRGPDVHRGRGRRRPQGGGREPDLRPEVPRQGRSPSASACASPSSLNFPDKVEDPWFEVIGVVADAKNQGLQEPPLPEAWIPYTVTGSGERGILVRTANDPLPLLNAVRKEIWATDRNVALTLTGSLEGFIGQFSYAGPRFGVPDDERSSRRSGSCS